MTSKVSTNIGAGKRPTTPKKQRTRSQSQGKGRIQEDVCVRTSLPPLVEGPVHSILICHVPKLRWHTKQQSISRSVMVKLAWWGEDDTSALFRPQITGIPTDQRQQLSTTAKYYVRSDMQQFAKYLTDAAELVLKIHDAETNRLLGTVKVQHLSTLTIQNPIKGYLPIFSNRGDKLGELFVSLRILLPGTHDSNENLNISDVSNSSSRRNSIVDQLDNGLRTYTLDRAYTTEHFNSAQSNENTTPFKTYTNDSKNSVPPGAQAYKEVPTGKVVEALIERANRLREDMIKSSALNKNTNPIESATLLNSNNNNAELLLTQSDDVDHLMDNEHVFDMLGMRTSLKSVGAGGVNDSIDSIVTDLDGLEHEQSLLDDLLYGKTNGNDNHSKITHDERQPPRPLRGKPPTGRSRSPSLSRVGGGMNNRSRSAKSSDSDTASRVSFDMPNSDVDDSGNESHDEENLSAERIQLLNHVRTARVRIDHLRLNTLNGRESPLHSSFGRTIKSKRATTYFIEYQFPVIANSRDGHVNEATEVMKIASKRFESNNDIIFAHLSTYPVLFNGISMKSWWRSLLVFKISSRISGSTTPEQIGFAVFPLRNLLKAEYLHVEQDLNLIDRTQIKSTGVGTRLPNRISRKFCIGHLRLMLELDSDASNFKLELDRVRLIEQSKPKKQPATSRVNGSKKQHRTGKGKSTGAAKKSKTLLINGNNELQMPRAFVSEGFMATESNGEATVVQIFLSIIEARNLPQTNLPCNPYFVCRSFWNDQPLTSIVCWGSSMPRFNFEQKMPLLLTTTIIEKMHQNFVVIEMWDKKISGPSDKLIGIVKIPLQQFHVSFKDKQISRVLLRAQYPVIAMDSWLSIIDPFTTNHKSNGEIKVLLAMGTGDQITAVQVAHTGGDSSASQKPTTNSSPDQSSLIEHQFEVMIESINGLRAFESMVWGECNCFIQYSFPIQDQPEQSLPTNANSIKPFQMRTTRTAATLCTSDPTFHDCAKFRYVLTPADALHKYFFAACQSTTTLDACIPFEVWSRFYYPNVRDQLLAKGKLPAAKLCSMTTMLSANTDDKSIQTFRIPLEIVREDPKQQQHHYSPAPAYGGDLLMTVTYKRSILKRNERQTLTDRLANGTSQVCLSVGIIRACGLKNAAKSQVRHDQRLNYPSQVGVNTYARLSLSFLSDMESRSTRTVARSFIPEFNHSIDFPLPLIWSNQRNESISLAEMLEHGELKIDIYHQMSSDTNATSSHENLATMHTDGLVSTGGQHVEKRPIDLHLCYCTIPLRELIVRHTGIKGWYPLASANRIATSDSSEHYVGGLDLFVRFAQQDDRRRVIDSAKALNWLDENYTDEEHFLDDQKDLGCLVTVTIDRIQFPLHLATRPGKEKIDEKTSVFVQYRLYDKMPIISKRKKPIIDRNNVICELKFNKEHLFLCSAPFIWYLREEKLEIQVWTSENDSYDYSQSSSSSTDKLIGSIYVDLNTLSDRKRKSHRLSAILPMFKHGTKDLGDAFVQTHITIDKSKDFNELRSRNGLDTSNDSELDSYLENRHMNLLGNDRALRTITNNVFSVIVNIEQAAHLPNVYSKPQNQHTLPNPYVTYATADSNHLCRTQILTGTCKPIWNYQHAVKLAVEHLFNEKKNFILKVWHKINADIESIPEKSGDKVLGFVSIDLSPLLSGMQQISGWYNIIDMVGNVQGQLKISVIPQEDLFELKRFKYNKTNSNHDSHRSTTSTTVPSLVMNDLSARSSATGQTSLNTSMIDDDNNKQSFLMNNLRRQLGELDVITERLKARYYSGSEVTSTTEPSSTITTGRSSSVPPPLSLPLAIRQDLDATHPQQSSPATTTTTTNTIQTDLSQHFPESLSGRPLISNGLNVTDVLSHHNDQIRLAQELVSKANHLLETSKDFFTKTPTPTTVVPSTIVEERLAPSPPPPPVLPNFNATSEFRTGETGHVNSFEQQHHNGTIVWSDEEEEDDDQHNQSFLPIGLPPSHHRLIVPAAVSPPPPPLLVEEFSTRQEQQDETDVVHIRPLNNLSAFNFDCQQMNAERLNGSSNGHTYVESPPRSVARRNIFSTVTTTTQHQDRPVPSSSFRNEHKTLPPPPPMVKRRSVSPVPSSSSSSRSSRSPTPPPLPASQSQQSFASDTSIIDGNWLQQQQQRTRDTHAHSVPPPALVDPSTVRQPPSRSPHLAFLDRPLPNFFPSNREMEASMKHISQALTIHDHPSTDDPSTNVMKTIIERLRTKSSSELLRGVSPFDGARIQPSDSSTTTNVTRVEKIFKTKYTASSPSS